LVLKNIKLLLMKIIPFSEKYIMDVTNICQVLTERFGYDNYIPLKDLLKSKNFQGFVALTGKNEIVGFVGVVFMEQYAFPFGLRTHPDFFRQNIGFLLSKYIAEYCFHLGYNKLRSSYLLDNISMPKIILKEDWKTIDKYLVVKKDNPSPSEINEVLVSFVAPDILAGVLKFVHSVKTGQHIYDSMFPANSLVWYSHDSADVFKELISFNKIIVAKDYEKKMKSVAVVEWGSGERGIVNVLRIWGEAEPVFNFIINRCQPSKIKWYIAETEEDKARSLGYDTNVIFDHKSEKLFESRYAIIEKLCKS